MADLISRQAIIDSLHSKFVDGFDSDRWWNSMSVLYAINKVPSVSTEKTGRWILTDKEEEIYCHVAICSVCGKESINEGVDDYCSWCGAKMEVENG